MKRFVVAILCLCLLISSVGCAQKDMAVEPKSGSYFLESDGEEIMTPYLHLDLENQSAWLTGGMAMSYAETGTVTLNGTQILVETRPTTYVFRIQDEKTLILTDFTGDNPFSLPIDGEFVYSETWN